MRPYPSSWLTLALLSCLLLSACASQRIYKGPATYANRSGELCCGLHRQKLVSAKGYAKSDRADVPPARGYVKWSRAFPNHHTEISATRSKDYPNPTSYRYCQACRDALKAKLQ